jgi:hypothetical protein
LYIVQCSQAEISFSLSFWLIRHLIVYSQSCVNPYAWCSTTTSSSEQWLLLSPDRVSAPTTLYPLPKLPSRCILFRCRLFLSLQFSFPRTRRVRNADK